MLYPNDAFDDGAGVVHPCSIDNDKADVHFDQPVDERFEIDDLAAQAGGYFALPTGESMSYTELLSDVCRQFGIRYYSATKKERYFVDEVTRVTWARQQEEKPGIHQDIRPAFSV